MTVCLLTAATEHTSMPTTCLAPSCCAATSTMLPSPQPRSYTCGGAQVFWQKSGKCSSAYAHGPCGLAEAQLPPAQLPRAHHISGADARQLEHRARHLWRRAVEHGDVLGRQQEARPAAQLIPDAARQQAVVAGCACRGRRCAPGVLLPCHCPLRTLLAQTAAASGVSAVAARPAAAMLWARGDAVLWARGDARVRDRCCCCAAPGCRCCISCRTCTGQEGGSATFPSNSQHCLHHRYAGTPLEHVTDEISAPLRFRASGQQTTSLQQL